METILNILTSALIGLLGMLFLTLWRSKKYFIEKGRTMSLKVLYYENIGAIVWVFLLVFLTAIIVNIFPGTAEGITAITGLAITTYKASFFTYGVGLMALVKRKKNNELRDKIK